MVNNGSQVLGVEKTDNFKQLFGIGRVLVKQNTAIKKLHVIIGTISYDFTGW